MPVIFNSGKKDCAQMKQALEKAKWNAKRIVEAEKTAQNSAGASDDAIENAETTPLRQKAA